ncbi:hypothetical protein LLE49_18470 [Alicyclobacillus tolerans]|uniref:hypothetical protein n=1 Tax=Alicyclobacillus tolerans TaxID=90970 RepID=UPI001F46D12F|nr:hypothetical protein [Alicyclobacillus tolerans]MCF8566713.1 hypothetical protein [Alicyclobacillus tolerans]
MGENVVFRDLWSGRRDSDGRTVRCGLVLEEGNPWVRMSSFATFGAEDGIPTGALLGAA